MTKSFRCPATLFLWGLRPLTSQSRPLHIIMSTHACCPHAVTHAHIIHDYCVSFALLRDIFANDGLHEINRFQIYLAIIWSPWNSVSIRYSEVSGIESVSIWMYKNAKTSYIWSWVVTPQSCSFDAGTIGDNVALVSVFRVHSVTEAKLPHTFAWDSVYTSIPLGSLVFCLRNWSPMMLELKGNSAQVFQ